MNATNLTNSSRKHKRRALDFYPTPPEVTHALLRFLDLPSGCRFWEPACGNGAMVDVIRSYGYDVRGTDIQTGDDFFECTPFAADWIVTNPPFNMSARFIERGCALAKVGCAMLLKSQYWHAKARADLFNSLPPAYVLPLTWRPDFLAGERGGAPTMECLWTVWIRGQTNAHYRLLERPKL